MSAEAAAQQTEDPYRGRTHGAVATYNVGCRCEPCRIEASRVQRERRERRATPVVLVRPEEWMDDAACIDQPIALFFPSGDEQKEHGAHLYALARSICAGCPVKTECLDYALEHNEAHGMWGGLSPRDRRGLRRQRRRNGAA